MQPAVIQQRWARLAFMRDVPRELRPKRAVAAKTQPKQSKSVVKRRPAKVRDPAKSETIVRECEGGTAVLFATGPSLTDEVVDMVLQARQRRQLYLFGCNDAYQIVPCLDVHYACDARWWQIHYKDLHDYPVTHGLWTQEPQMSRADYPRLRRIAGRSGKGLSIAQDLIFFGNNSGYQLINVAFLFGIKRMILCGYNMSVRDGKRHFFGDHPQGLNRSGNYTGFVSNFNTIKPNALGIEIVNATPASALTAFPKVSLEEALRISAV